jgi:hypothetical protein
MTGLVSTLLILGVVAALAYLASSEIETKLKRRRLMRIKKVERELAETQRHLETLVMQHQVWLNAQAHEARKALIMESFLAPKDIREKTSSLTRRS